MSQGGIHGEFSAGNGLLIIERILRDRAGIWRDIIEERGLRDLIVQMLTSSAISLALYGAVLGASFGWQQALSSFIKLPLLFLATLCICLPTPVPVQLWSSVRGWSVVQAVALIMVCVTVTSVLTLAFAPISLFFLVTAQSYAFFKLLNVAILTLTAIVGLRFLIGGMRALNAHQELEALRAAPVPVGAPAVPVPAANGVPCRSRCRRPTDRRRSPRWYRSPPPGRRSRRPGRSRMPASRCRTT